MSRNIYGLDVSEYQGDILWYNVRVDPKPVSFVWTRATMGVERVDKNFSKNWDGIGFHISPIPYVKYNESARFRGAYHYFHSKSGGVDQAQHFCSTVLKQDNIKQSDVFALDAEYKDPYVPLDVYIQRVSYFIHWFKTKGELKSHKLYLYSGLFFMRSVLLPNLSHDTIKSVIPWVARYTNDAPYIVDKEVMQIIKGHNWDSGVALWQYTDKGRVDGINSPVDCNITVFKIQSTGDKLAPNKQDGDSKSSILLRLLMKFLQFLKNLKKQ